AWRERLSRWAVHGFGIVIVGLGLGAAALLPRFDVIRRTNLAGGDYSDIVKFRMRGWNVSLLIDRLLSYEQSSRIWYAGGATLALALIALFSAKRRLAVPYFLVLTLIIFDLALFPNWVHDVFFL